MKTGIHPNYHEITVVNTDGTEFKTRSTYGKEGDKLRLDVDPKTHPAWNKGGYMVMENVGQMDKFKKRYGGYKLGGVGGKKEGQKAEVKAEEKKEDKK